MITLFRRKNDDAERLKIAEELLAKVRRAADRKRAHVTEIRSILEAGRVKQRLIEEKRGKS